LPLLLPATGAPYTLTARPHAVINPVEAAVMTAAMNTARVKLLAAIAITQAVVGGTAEGHGIVPVGFGALLEYAFRPGPLPANMLNAANAALVGLQQINTGLNAATLEVVDSNPRRGGIASGYVRMTVRELFRRADPARPRDNVGRIHIRLATYGGAATPVNINNAASTLVHEASHKFSGTRDWGYMAEGAAGYMGMVAMGMVPALGGGAVLTNPQGLNNADSYAAFVMSMP
jgi:hypothetical protein